MISGAGKAATFELTTVEETAYKPRLSDATSLYLPSGNSRSRRVQHCLSERPIAKYMRLIPAVRTVLINFSNGGFVSYDSKEDRAIIKARLYYYLRANVGKTELRRTSVRIGHQGAPECQHQTSWNVK